MGSGFGFCVKEGEPVILRVCLIIKMLYPSFLGGPSRSRQCSCPLRAVFGCRDRGLFIPGL